MPVAEQIIPQNIAHAASRLELWVRFVQAAEIKQMAELGVYSGDYAAELLQQCPAIEKYYMIDPWRYLDDWNKPANDSDDIFAKVLAETKAKTEFAAEKRVILRGKTTEVIDEIPDESLDFCYVDGDHTLKGITIDLIRIYPKLRTGGWLGGDDFLPTIWQHRTYFEPTLVFPFAVYFAEAVNARIYALPFSQFLIEKNPEQTFSFVDLTGEYKDVGLQKQFELNKILQLKVKEIPARVKRVAKHLKNLAGR